MSIALTVGTKCVAEVTVDTKYCYCFKLELLQVFYYSQKVSACVAEGFDNDNGSGANMWNKIT